MSEDKIRARLDRWLDHLEMLEATNMLTPAQKQNIADDIVQWSMEEYAKLAGLQKALKIG